MIQVQHLPEVIERSNTDIYAIVRINDPDPSPHGDVDRVEILEGDNNAHFRIRKSKDDPKEFNVSESQCLRSGANPWGAEMKHEIPPKFTTLLAHGIVRFPADILPPPLEIE